MCVCVTTVAMPFQGTAIPWPWFTLVYLPPGPPFHAAGSCPPPVLFVLVFPLSYTKTANGSDSFPF